VISTIRLSSLSFSVEILSSSPLTLTLILCYLTFLGHMIERCDAESRLLKGHRGHITTRERPRRHLRLRFVTIKLTRYGPDWLMKLLNVIGLRDREELATGCYPMHLRCMQLMRVDSFHFIDVTCLVLNGTVIFRGLRVVGCPSESLLLATSGR
jgi:hypothetical protein